MGLKSSSSFFSISSPVTRWQASRKSLANWSWWVTKSLWGLSLFSPLSQQATCFIVIIQSIIQQVHSSSNSKSKSSLLALRFSLLDTDGALFSPSYQARRHLFRASVPALAAFQLECCSYSTGTRNASVLSNNIFFSHRERRERELPPSWFGFILTPFGSYRQSWLYTIYKHRRAGRQYLLEHQTSGFSSHK